MLRLPRITSLSHLEQKHEGCCLCGKATHSYELDFYSGSSAPAPNDILAGVASGETGTVSSVELVGGAWSDGDAHGTIVFKSGTGSSDFEIDEAIDNHTDSTFNVLTVSASTQRWRGGRRYPTTQVVKYKGNYYCVPHLVWRRRHIDMSKAKINVKETDE
jgi:hypothetical protein